MKKNLLKGFVAGVLTACLAFGLAYSAGADREIRVSENIKLTLNGQTFIPRDANGNPMPVFVYNGTTFLPMRALCEAIGLDVRYDAATRTAAISEPDAAPGKPGAPVSPAPDDYISAEKAQQLAREHAGVANPTGLRCQFDWDDGRAVYEIEFWDGRIEYDYEIDALTGAVRDFDRDYD